MAPRRLKLAIPLLMVVSVILFFQFGKAPFERIVLRKNSPAYLQESPSHLPNFHTGLNSDVWIPLIVSECVDGLYKNSAPCIQKRHPHSNLIKAQELFYKPFRLRVPQFLSEQHKQQWLEAVSDLDRMRVSNDKEWADYPTANAQNLVFRHTAYSGTPRPDDWSSEACMDFGASHEAFLKDTKSREEKSPFDHETLVVATSPDSWSWQHFLDRVTVVWSQSLFVLEPEAIGDVTIISGKTPTSPFVDEMYKMMGVKGHVHYRDGQAPHSARQLVFSCRAPLIHPYTTQKVTEMMGVDIHKVPLSKRKVVIYMSRSHGDISNSGRQIINEAEFLTELEALLEKRGQGEKLKLFDRREYSSIQDIVKYFSNNVRAIIAPHGSALHNGRFASANTLVLEFMPVGRFQSCFWEQSHLLEQNYFVYMAQSLNDDHDMRIEDIDSMINLLDRHLGQVPNATLVETYPWWNIEPVGVV